MRQTRFRGRDAMGEWMHGALVNGYADDGSPVAYIATALPVGTEDFEHFSVPLHIVVPDTVGQKSEWQDCEGQPIYEGDIVELMMHDGTIRRFEVRYGYDDRLMKPKPGFAHDGNYVRVYGWFFVWKYHWLLPTVRAGGCCDTDNMKVIGNIYDAPELLDN